MTSVKIISAASLVVGAAAPAWAQPGYQGGGWGPGMMGSWWGGGGLGMIFTILIWVAVIAAIVAAVRWLFSRGGLGAPPQQPQGDRALQVLRERFARGEISQEEYRAMRRELED